MTKLSVNINKIALLRNQRDLEIPSVLWAADEAVQAGAYGITVHPRPDERHVRYSDVYELSDFLSVEFNIEGNPLEGRYMEVVCDVKPTQATLVPDLIGAVTSDHGWDLTNKSNCDKLIPIIDKLKSKGIRVSLFADPVSEVIEKAKEIGTDRVELYTEPYARAFENGTEQCQKSLAEYAAAAKLAGDVGLEVNAGHDLNLDNLGLFCKNVNNVAEVSIGHALIADALKMGLSRAVKEYLKILKEIS